MQAILFADRWLNLVPYADLAATLVLIASLTVNGLHAVYRYFFAYLATDALETATGLIFQQNRKLYAEIYFAGQGLKMLLAVFVVLEIYRIALAGQPALAHFGKRTVMYILAAAAMIAGAGFWMDRGAASARPPVLREFASFERTMDAWMLLFLLMISVFMLWFPVRLKRNGVVYISGFVVYFLARSVGLLLTNIAPGLIAKLDTTMLAAQLFCLVLWTVALQPAGERAVTVVGHRWDPAAAERLKDQLNAINTALLRLSGR